MQVVTEYFLFQIAEEYDFVPRKLVEDYCSDCTVRTLKRAQHVTAPLQPILTSNFMERLQVIDNCDRTARVLNISVATEKSSINQNWVNWPKTKIFVAYLMFLSHEHSQITGLQVKGKGSFSLTDNFR